jgi:hypothetical protein
MTQSDPEVTGAEAAYMKTLVDMGIDVVVVLKTGEELPRSGSLLRSRRLQPGTGRRRSQTCDQESSIRYLYEEAR